jgi:hypothetical protein
MAIAGVDQNIEQNRKQLLEAIAAAGSAGEKAYKDAQSQIGTYRQEAIANAGKGFSGSADLAAQLQAQSGAPFDRRLADSQSAQADNASWLAKNQAANDNYLTNVSSAQGTLQAINQNKLSDREFALKQAQAELEARAKQEAEDRAFERQMKLLDLQMKQESHKASLAKSQASAASKAAKENKLTKAQLPAPARRCPTSTPDSSARRPAARARSAPTSPLGRSPPTGASETSRSIPCSAPATLRSRPPRRSRRAWTRTGSLRTPGTARPGPTRSSGRQRSDWPTR